MSYDVLTPAAAELWPYSPNWSAGFTIKRSFATDIFDSRDNHEQRRALNVAPRFAVNYRTVVQDAERNEASRWLRRFQNKPAIIPDFTRWARLTGASGASTLTVSPLPPWVGEAQRLALCGAALESVLVASVAGTTITLDDPLVGTWGIGAVLRPTFRGLLEGRLSSERMNKAAAQISISLDVYPGGEPPRATGTAWASVGTREVFTPLPDYAGSPSLDYLWPVESVDFKYGRTAQFRPIDTPQNLVEADFNGLDTGATAEVEQFFDRMKGRRTAFYLPSGESDASFVASGASSVTVAGADLAQGFASFDFGAFEYGVAVWLTDGTALYRRIASVAVSGANSVITVTTAWGVGLTSVARISLMPLVRFASDEMTTTWRSALSSRIRLAFQTVRR